MAHGNVDRQNVGYAYFETLDGSYLYRVDECDMAFDAPGGYVDLTASCNNGLFDPEDGETDVDCGGNCTPCGPPDLPCTRYQDIMSFSTVGMQDEAVTSAFTSFYQGVYRIEFTTSSFHRIGVTLKMDKLPENTRRFDIGPNDNEAWIEYDVYSDSWVAKREQFVYLIKGTNGRWNINFCNHELYQVASGSAFASANLSFSL